MDNVLVRLGTHRTASKVNPSCEEEEGRQTGNPAERDFGHPVRPIGNTAGAQAPTSSAQAAEGEHQGPAAPPGLASQELGTPVRAVPC